MRLELVDEGAPVGGVGTAHHSVWLSRPMNGKTNGGQTIRFSDFSLLCVCSRQNNIITLLKGLS